MQADIDNFKAALQGAQVEEAFLPAVAPGTMEHWMKNQYYPSAEAYLFAIADAMHEEYKAIVDAGFILQIDDPDLADAWQMHPEMNVAEYRKYQEIRIDALNHALGDVPTDRVRFHMCWGSYHGPHKYDIPLRDIVDLILKVRAGAYSIEASNPCHEHEWRVWQETQLPDGKILIPGVAGHYSDFIEHPRSIADRLVQYAKVVTRKCHRRHRLRHRHASRSPQGCLGQVSSHGRGRAACNARALGSLAERGSTVSFPIFV